MPQAVRCAYSVEGNGPALVLSHGFGGSHQNWAYVVDILKSHFKCVSYDLRGHGASPMSELPITLEDLVADVEALREELGLKKIHVFGNSLGGMVAPAYARAYPNRTMSVGLISTAAFRPEEVTARTRATAEAIRTQGAEKLIDGFAARWFTEEFAQANPDLVETRKKQTLGTNQAALAEGARIYAETEMGPWLKEITVPALVLTGENDVNCNPGLSTKIAAALPNAKLVIVERLKHALTVEDPPRIAAEMMSFLAAVPES